MRTAGIGSPFDERFVTGQASLPPLSMLSAKAMKILSAFSIAIGFTLLTALAENPQNGAIEALQALPPHFTDQIVRASADNGRPNPARWYVLARNPREAGFLVKDPVYSITIVRGQLSEAKRSLDVRQVMNRRNFVDLARVRVDSDQAFEIARNALGSAGERMRSASYQLTQIGPAADPIWDVWAYGKRDRYLGVVRLSARTGDVISSRRPRLL